MIYVWLFIATGSAIFVTYMGFVQGFSEWYQFYAFTLIAVFMIFMKRAMMKRYRNYQEKVENKKE